MVGRLEAGAMFSGENWAKKECPPSPVLREKGGHSKPRASPWRRRVIRIGLKER